MSTKDDRIDLLWSALKVRLGLDIVSSKTGQIGRTKVVAPIKEGFISEYTICDEKDMKLDVHLSHFIVPSYD
tara:strand:- start:341 stop:556 length:216 start_codon:yes stop_codon:yes gene_type:complete